MTVNPECDSCPKEGGEADMEVCPQSKSPCGHHCNHSWSHDACCWCRMEWGEGGVVTRRSS